MKNIICRERRRVSTLGSNADSACQECLSLRGSSIITTADGKKTALSFLIFILLQYLDSGGDKSRFPLSKK